MRIYVSHPIRGKKGEDATDEEMEINCNRAIKFGNTLKSQFSGVDFFVPGEHDEFASIALKKGRITIAEVLETDCDIIDTCDAIVVWCPENYISDGMMVELSYANTGGIPTFIVQGPAGAIQAIGRFLEGTTR